MKSRILIAAVTLASSAVLVRLQAAPPHTAPELTHSSQAEWLNSKPLTLANLRGKAVLIEFWTFDCVNCRNSLVWMKSVADRKTRDGLAIIAVHSPELAHERVPENIRNAVRKLGIDYPVMLDVDLSYWNAMHNEYWPAFYLIDKSGRLREQVIGELHVGERRAQAFEASIDRL